MTETQPRPAPREVTSSDAAVLSAVVKRFTNARGEEFAAVNGLDLRIRRGEVVAFLGPNGAGKTTAIDMLLGLARPDSGHVELFGGPPQQAVRAGRVAAVLQSGGLLPDLTVEATVRMLGSLHTGTDPEAVMSRAGITRLRHRRVSECSGGEQQRLRFAVALLSNPEFLVLDEPTAGMDVAARREFWATVREDVQRGMTVLFATHYMEEADQFADRVVMVDQGRVVADGSASSIRAAFAGRTVSAQISPSDAAAVAASPGVRSCVVRGDRHFFDTTDSDALLRVLVNRTSATEIEVVPRSLEEAFMAITTNGRTDLEGLR
ncbi:MULTISPECIES: ABC transporter ATP-binding protein [unclassified Streptomyces]|uniref:ABC transporter ATP-binding protein n=1 Tax=unclassified Streptomyces TaxID=2593676 RepID=UPI001F035002|nr:MULTISPECIES: ABC transporter ATP-binding protein [unclassified Streptomyces]MCH0566851.1 ABC transporter ATP-binding protein [Streptomyces sp. MUM 2J]MCH0569414.1 ABC transporter ATP-binding protein [Streptomyces sp. MUM 136J]